MEHIVLQIWANDCNYCWWVLECIGSRAEPAREPISSRASLSSSRSDRAKPSLAWLGSFLALAEGSCHQLIFFLRIVPENFIAHCFYQLQPFSAGFAGSFLELKPIRKSNKFILFPFFLFLLHSPPTRSWKRPICQIFLHQVLSADMLCHNSKFHLGQVVGGPQLHVAQGSSHAEAQS